MKVAVTALIVMASGYFLYQYNTVQVLDCSADPTLNCLNAAIREFDFEKNLKGNKDYYYFADDLIEAGHYDIGLSLLERSDYSLTDLAASKMIAMQLSDLALSRPEETVDWSLVNELIDPNTRLGKIALSKSSSDETELSFYSKLSWYLYGAAGSGGGDKSYVEYNEKISSMRFKPFATWNALIEKWYDAALKANERTKNLHLTFIADHLYRVGMKDRAYEILIQSEPTKNNLVSHTKLLEKLGRFEEAQEVRKSLGSMNESSIALAKYYVDNQEFEKAIRTIRDAKIEILNNQSPKDSKSDKAQRLRAISKLAYEVGDHELALEIAELANDIEELFINYADWSSHYRSIGRADKAMEVMERFAKPIDNDCSPFASLEQYAVEFYHLGRLDLAADKINEFCDSVTIFSSLFGYKSADLDKERNQLMAWSRLYQDAIITGKKTDEIVNYAGKAVITASYPYLAMHYLNNGDQKSGEQYLEKSIDNMNTKYAPNCQMAYLANSANRIDLLTTHFDEAISDINSNFQGMKKISAYLKLAACHNQIRIDRLRLQ